MLTTLHWNHFSHSPYLLFFSLSLSSLSSHYFSFFLSNSLSLTLPPSLYLSLSLSLFSVSFLHLSLFSLSLSLSISHTYSLPHSLCFSFSFSFSLSHPFASVSYSLVPVSLTLRPSHSLIPFFLSLSCVFLPSHFLFLYLPLSFSSSLPHSLSTSLFFILLSPSVCYNFVFSLSLSFICPFLQNTSCHFTIIIQVFICKQDIVMFPSIFRT